MFAISWLSSIIITLLSIFIIGGIVILLCIYELEGLVLPFLSTITFLIMGIIAFGVPIFNIIN